MAVTTMSTSGSCTIWATASAPFSKRQPGGSRDASNCFGRFRVGERHPARPIALGLAQQGIAAGMGAEAKYLQAVAQVVHDIEAVGADRAGGAEHDQTAARARHDRTGIRGHEAPVWVAAERLLLGRRVHMTGL